MVREDTFIAGDCHEGPFTDHDVIFFRRAQGIQCRKSGVKEKSIEITSYVRTYGLDARMRRPTGLVKKKKIRRFVSPRRFLFERE